MVNSFEIIKIQLEEHTGKDKVPINFENKLESNEEYVKDIYKGLRKNPDDIRFSMIEQGHDMMKEYR